MPASNRRRSRAYSSSEDDELTRPSTPVSTAPGDAKRLRAEAAAAVGNAERSRPQAGASAVQNATSRRRKHQPGAILRVKLENFVTYTSAEFFPGPNLNMVIGPNGTGKSTLVCAICLGLGWSPNLLGRARDVAEFVKHGAKEAMIEIELQRVEHGENKTNQNPIIRRRILKDDTKSAYWINDRSVPHKTVQELMRVYNIQVDNLCQFLPQDRVVEFAQMTPVEMLETTLQAAAHPDVLEQHNDLKARRLELQNFMYTSKGDRDRLASLKKRQDAQQPEIERLKERVALQKTVGDYQRCMCFAEYVEAKEEVSVLKKAKRDLAGQVKSLEETAEPTLERLNQKRSYAQQAKQNLESTSTEAKRAENECKRLMQEIKVCEDTIQDQERQIKAEDTAKKADRQTLTKHHKTLGDLKIQRDNKPAEIDTRAVNQQIEQHRRHAREVESEYGEIRNELESAQKAGREAQASKKKLEEEVTKLATHEGQQQERLKNLSSDTAKAWDWIKENQDKFENEVFGPPAVTCTVVDQSFAGAMETVIQANDLKIIVVQSTKDFNTLRNHLVSLRISDYSLRTITPNDLATSNLKPPVSKEQLENLGLERWAIDCIQGPPSVVMALAQSAALYRTAIGRNNITTEQHQRIAATAMAGYVGGRKYVKFTRRSEYGDAGTAAKISDTKAARIWTDKPGQSSRAKELADQIKLAKVAIHSNKEIFETLGARRTQLDTEMQREQEAIEHLESERATYQQNMAVWNGVPVKIEQVERTIEELTTKIAGMKDRVTALLEKSDQAMFAKIRSTVQLTVTAQALRESISRAIEAEVLNIEAHSDYRNLQEMNKTLTQTLAMKRTEHEMAQENYQTKLTAAKALADTCRTTAKVGDDLEENEGDSSLSDLIRQVNSDPDLSVAGMKEKIESLKSRLEMVAGGLADQNSIRDFEDRAKQIEKLGTKLETFNQQQEAQMREIKTIRTAFEHQLQPIIQQIDQAFGESFARIGCAGQVSVYKASSEDPADCTEIMGGVDNGLDFANWAIHISVKFRDSEPLSLLDSHRQSGGERAVSTIFYLMALQSLSKSPFRVVDEINQGMDQRNERMVHGRMVDIAAAMERRVAAGEASGSQYFLITPKLLSGLKYERGMTVLCIVSGENMPSATDKKVRLPNGGQRIEKAKKIDFKLLAQRAKELGFDAAANAANSHAVGRVVSIGA